VIIEKPFGTDLETAQALNQKVLSVAKERQVYRIDHYLGKETVQNLLVFRFGNAIFEPLWSRNHLSHIQITVSETVGLEGRAGYYEEAGVLKDMVQNHLMQLLCLVCMEPPVAFDAKSVRDEKVKVLKALRLDGGVGHDLSRSVVRGQYTSGWAGSLRVPGYREEPDVQPESSTATYVALKFAVDNWRWKGVPIYLRTGKRLTKRVSEIALQFKDVPQQLFPDEAPSPNVLALRIQPDQGVSLRFEAKRPGPKIQMQPVNMDFRYGSAFGMETPEAYERLLLDCMVGDQTLFTRADEVEEAWRVVAPVLQGWEENKVPISFYESGSWGPVEADRLIQQDGFRWRRL
jgi:glucose-6-phosphate 1-dehydrogenase